LIEIINKQLLLQLVGYLCYWQMGFNSVFKGLTGFMFPSFLLYSVRTLPVDAVKPRVFGENNFTSSVRTSFTD
jgi:hypothetical protein